MSSQVFVGEGVVLVARLLPSGSVSVQDGNEKKLVLRSTRFLETARTAMKAKSGKFQMVGPERLQVVFSISGRVGETEVEAVEAARRLIYDVRRGNSEEGPKLEIMLAIDTGPLAYSPIQGLDGLAELIVGPAVASTEKLLEYARPDGIVVSETAYQRVSFIYRGRPLESAPEGEKIYELIV